MNSCSLLTNAIRATLALAGLSAGLLLSCGETSDEGGVMVVITTDLAVPHDIDTLLWSVRLSGEAEAFRSGAFALESYEVLPVTLSIAAGRDTTKPITIRLSGLKGGEGGLTRVTREARLSVPAHGMKELRLSLDFLCTTASLASPCAEGETCRSGECVSSAVEQPSSLESYLPTTDPGCFDTLRCFQSLDAEPNPTSDSDGCFIKGSNVRLAPNANLAMVVSSARVGKFGACGAGADGACLVPLPRGGPEGWEPLSEAGETVRIRLPAAVCGALGRSIDKLLVAPSDGACPTLEIGTPLCAVSDACVQSEGVCPSDWGPGWLGYACSESGPDGEFGRCFWPNRASGLICCQDASYEPSSEENPDPLLIDDMSLGPVLKFDVPAGYLPGNWWTAVEDSAPSSIAPTTDFFYYQDIDPPFTSPDGKTTIKSAACLRSPHGFTGWLAMMGFDLLSKPGINGPAGTLDVSRYTGVRFFAMARPPFLGFAGFSKDILVLFPNIDTLTYGSLSNCLKQNIACDDFRTALTITDSWVEYTIGWEALKQQGFGAPYPTFDKNLFQVMFAAEGPGPTGKAQPFEFCISQIYFTQDEQTSEKGKP